MRRDLTVTIILTILAAGATSYAETAKNLARSAKVKASSQMDQYTADKVVDGKFNNTSRWLSKKSNGPHLLEIDLGKTVDVGCVQMITGWQDHGQWTSAVRNFKFQFYQNGRWVDDRRATKTKNKSCDVEIYLVEPVKASKVRFVSTDAGPVRIAEIRVFEWGQKYPPIFEKEKIVFTKQPVFVNQSGYNLNWPKRFTAPLIEQQGTFTITEKDSDTVLYNGVVKKGVGDFSDFKPSKRGIEYIITVAGGDLKAGTSDPFQIEPHWMQQVSLEPALRFMQDARSVAGTHPSGYGGSPWRDGTYYSYEMPSLVLMYLSAQSVFDRLPIEMSYAQDKKKVLDPSFKLVKTTKDAKSLETARRYYTELDGPVGEKVPDIISVIHWGVGWYLMDPKTHDPSGDSLGDRIHPQTIEQFAYFLYGYPMYRQYFTEKFYRQAYNFTFDHWGKVGLFDVNKKIGTFKGRHCPGHSIMPNLMMYQVAKRDGRGDTRLYMQAAQKQTQWIIDELDWNDPTTTKGQRMSEHKLMTGLIFFLKLYPDEAPAGLQEKIDQWVDIMIARSDNMWDLRRYNDKDWSLPRFTPGSHGGAGWNDPGNVAGFPGVCFAVAMVTDDAVKKQRLMEIGAGHFDNLFGRNPLGAHSGYLGVQDYVGVERGWPKMFPKNRCARLELVRGTLNSSCTTEHYPFNPELVFRHVEGWTAFNAAFNVSLAAACHLDKLTVDTMVD